MVAMRLLAPSRGDRVPAGFGVFHRKRARWPLPVSRTILCISFLLIAVWASTASAADRATAPTAFEIERLVRTAIVEGNDRLPSLLPLKGAELLKFRLVSRDRTSTTRWHAEVDLLFDYGPAPAAVLGFERFRAGRYWIVVDWTGGVFELSRFAPVGRVQPMPSG